MIKANELRIGNWVRDYYGKYKQVAYVGETIGLHNDCGGTDKYQDKPIFSKDLRDLHPIPLTPEILEKVGFERKIDTAVGIGEYDWYDNGRFETIHVYENWITLKGVDSVPLKYLHQLQNLYFALTGEELTYSSPSSSFSGRNSQ